MASFSDLKKIRLEINDPAGVIEILEVAEESALPQGADIKSQTAYLQDDTGEYKVYEDAWEKAELEVSDATLSSWLSSYGEAETVCRAFNWIARRLGKRLQLVRTQAGAESSEYTALKEQYTYYQAMAKDCREEKRRDGKNLTGRMGVSKQAEVGGGNL